MAYIDKAKTDEWETPRYLFDQLNDEFRFTLDVCATKENAKCSKYFTREENGLSQDWGCETVWCNPPYGRSIKYWVWKCLLHSIGGGVAVMLIPARTDTKWFHEYIYCNKKLAEVRFVRGRIKFGGSKHNAPFASMIVVFRGKENERED